MAPRDDIEEEKEYVHYSNALEWSLNNRKIKNITLKGPSLEVLNSNELNNLIIKEGV